MDFNTILLFISGLGLGAFVVYLVLRRKLQAKLSLDEETAEKNRILQEEVAKLEIRKAEISDTLQMLEANATNSAEVFYKTKMEAATANYNAEVEKLKAQYKDTENSVALNLDRELERLHQEFIIASEQFQKEYEDILSSSAGEIVALNAQLAELTQHIAYLRAEEESAVQARKREEEIRSNGDFYRIQLSREDLKEIEMLRNVAPYLRDNEPLNKVIWKYYYEKPTTDLIGRVIGSGVHTGIYKITNLENGMCYIGQAANLADRWKQHIKRGVGADTPTRNKLYPVMMALGPENFSFEVVEECDRSRLDEREDYWQEYFKAKEFGYSIK